VRADEARYRLLVRFQRRCRVADLPWETALPAIFPSQVIFGRDLSGASDMAQRAGALFARPAAGWVSSGQGRCFGGFVSEVVAELAPAYVGTKFALSGSGEGSEGTKSPRICGGRRAGLQPGFSRFLTVFRRKVPYINSFW